jgi:hypothetical protein
LNCRSISSNPGHLGEIPSLVEAAVFHSQQRLVQPVGAVENVGVGVSLGAQEASIDRVLRVALDRRDVTVLCPDYDAAADAAETANAFFPGYATVEAGGISVARHRHTDRRRGGGRNARLDEVPPREDVFHSLAPVFVGVFPAIGWL